MLLFPKSVGVILSLWPHSLRNMDFWEVFALSPSARIVKGPCQVLKGVTIARIPTSQAPEDALANWPMSTPEMAGFQWFSVYGVGLVPLDERQPNIN